MQGRSPWCTRPTRRRRRPRLPSCSAPTRWAPRSASRGRRSSKPCADALIPYTLPMTKRAIILVMDSFGLGATPDAVRFGDDGADTLGHIAERRAAQGKPLQVPNLARLGLGLAAHLVHGRVLPGITTEAITGVYGAAR